MAIRRSIRNHPDAKVVVVGCYAVSDRAEIEAIEGVDLVLGNDEKEAFVASLGAQPSTAPCCSSASVPVRPSPNQRFLSASARTSRYRPVATSGARSASSRRRAAPSGPWTRTRSIEEARMRVAAGARELVLTGVHLGKYTYDTGGDESDLVRLFRRLLEIDGVWRLRLSSILSRTSHRRGPRVHGRRAADVPLPPRAAAVRRSQECSPR